MSQRVFGVVLMVSLAFCAGVTVGQRPVSAQGEDKPETQPKPKKPRPAAKMPPLKLERLNSRGQGGRSFQVFRAKIPGGWLVFARLPGKRGGAVVNNQKPPVPGGASVAFVPDVTHAWNGGSVD